jgi:hypothetical protein
MKRSQHYCVLSAAVADSVRGWAASAAMFAPADCSVGTLERFLSFFGLHDYSKDEDLFTADQDDSMMDKDYNKIETRTTTREEF